MLALCVVLRFLGILLGLLVMFLGLIDLTGLIPDSEDPSSFLERLRVDVPLLMAAAFLLVPFAKLRGRLYLTTLGGLGALSLLLAVLSIWVVYQMGGPDWIEGSAALSLFGVVSGNCFVLWYWRRHPETAA